MDDFKNVCLAILYSLLTDKHTATKRCDALLVLSRDSMSFFIRQLTVSVRDTRDILKLILIVCCKLLKLSSYTTSCLLLGHMCHFYTVWTFSTRAIHGTNRIFSTICPHGHICFEKLPFSIDRC